MGPVLLHDVIGKEDRVARRILVLEPPEVSVLLVQAGQVFFPCHLSSQLRQAHQPFIEHLLARQEEAHQGTSHSRRAQVTARSP